MIFVNFSTKSYIVVISVIKLDQRSFKMDSEASLVTGTENTDSAEFPQNIEAELTEVADNEIIRISKKAQRYCIINFNLVNWSYMNVSMKFSDETYIFKIKEALKKRHGCMDELKLCINAYADENEIQNEMLTLRDIGCVGKEPTNLMVGPNGNTIFDESELPKYHFFYDFRPSNLLDPLLLY